MLPVSWLAMAVVFTALAQFAFKMRFKTRQWRWVVVAAALFAATPYAAYRALMGLPLATVYVATAASQLLIVALSLTVLREKYSPRQYTGFALILVGIVLYNT